MTLMENLFQTTGNATNRTLPFRRFAAAAVWRACARTVCICTYALHGLRHRIGVRHVHGGNDKRSRQARPFVSRFLMLARASATPASSINVAKASATLSLDMTAEEAAATPFYANFTQ